MIYFSPSTHGFFDDTIHAPRQIAVPDDDKLNELIAEGDADDEQSEGFEEREHSRQLGAVLAFKMVDNPDCQIPHDAVPVSAGDHARLMGEVNDGKELALDGDQVVAVDRERSLDDQLAEIRAKRDLMLSSTDWTQMPDALTAAKRKLWADHRKALRELPGLVDKAVKAGKSPDSVSFPEPPAEKGSTAK